MECQVNVKSQSELDIGGRDTFLPIRVFKEHSREITSIHRVFEKILRLIQLLLGMSNLFHFVTLTNNWIHHLHSRNCTREIFVCQPKPKSKPPKKYNNAFGVPAHFTFISYV